MYRKADGCWPNTCRAQRRTVQRGRVGRYRRRTRMSTERYKSIDAAAGDWFARRDSGAWTDEDQRLFDRWLNESPLNRVAYLRVEHVWERAERLRALSAGTPANTVPPPGRWVF